MDFKILLETGALGEPFDREFWLKTKKALALTELFLSGEGEAELQAVMGMEPARKLIWELEIDILDAPLEDINSLAETLPGLTYLEPQLLRLLALGALRTVPTVVTAEPNLLAWPTRLALGASSSAWPFPVHPRDLIKPCHALSFDSWAQSLRRELAEELSGKTGPELKSFLQKLRDTEDSNSKDAFRDDLRDLNPKTGDFTSRLKLWRLSQNDGVPGPANHDAL
ncbi:MAG: hypothetical protein LBP22_00165 [Deltaproteobacteria bacterium]|jgi:hypothetical protein|nr:hypothetical protein [Deltaproteobacteria bacterium]